MEIALITIPGLQFNELPVIQDGFPKRSNSFVMNPLHFLIHTTDACSMIRFIVLISDLWWLEQDEMYVQNVHITNWTSIAYNYILIAIACD